MKRLLSIFLLLALFIPSVAADKLKDIAIQPGETVYARFEIERKKLRLVGVSRETDPNAQVIFTTQLDAEKKTLKLKVENKLSKDLVYKVVISAKSLGLRSPAVVSPVVAGKVSYESFPGAVEEVLAFDFKFPR